MKELITTLTQRGQVTVPAEVRRLLGVHPREKIAFQIEGNEVKLCAAKFNLESAYGSVKPIHKPEDFEEITRQAKEEHVKRTMRKLGKT